MSTNQGGGAGHPGDLLAFVGDAPHVYRTGAEPADVTVVIASPISS
ncbi:hypothetical protein ACFVZR_34185 [Streptomyces sp. NPDC058316]